VCLLTPDRVVSLEPGQTRPLPFRVMFVNANAAATQITIRYGDKQREGLTSDVKSIREIIFSLTVHKESRTNPQKVTHLHPGGIVSYAVLRPPSHNATCLESIKKAPILLQFHGAGVEADNGIVAHSLDPLPDICAWVLFPTGVTPWSGDDWRKYSRLKRLAIFVALC
jgi:hypothetical protein